MEIVAALRAALGETAVLDAAADRAAYEQDWRHLVDLRSACVVLPRDTAQVADSVRICAANGAKIVPQGGNTGLVAGAVPAAGGEVILSLKRMDRVREIDPDGDFLIVEAGATLKAVQDRAAELGRLFPVSLGAEGTAQIGGVISTNAGGVQVLSYGSMRAQVLGLEVVLADGRVWDGLRALRKDNTGFDLKQVFIGAEGTLGIVTAACLRLLPAVTSRVAALVGVADAAAGAKLFQCLREAAGQGLTSCEFLSGPAMRLAGEHAPEGCRIPFEAGAYVLAELSGHGVETAGAELLEAVLAAALEAGLACDAVIAQSERERAAFWALREAVPEGEAREGGAVKHDVSVPLGRLAELAEAAERLAADRYPDWRLDVFGHIGDGNLHINFRPPAGRALAGMGPVKAEITRATENLAVAMGGSFSAEHGIGQLRVAGMAAHKSAVELDMMRALKRAFDPRGLFNPGKMLPPGGEG